MGLGEYRRKRNFQKTPEPRGKRTANLPARLSKLKNDRWIDLAKTKQWITAAMLKRLAIR